MKERRKRRKEREKRQTCRCHAIWARRCAFGVPLPVAPGNVARRELAVSALPTSAAALRFVSHGRASPCPRLSRFPSTPVLRTTAKTDYFLSYELRVLLETRRRLLVSQTVLDNKSVVHIAHLNSEINFNETISSYLQSSVRHETKDWLTIRQREKCQRFGAHSMFKQPREKCEKRKVSTLPLKTWYLRSR